MARIPIYLKLLLIIIAVFIYTYLFSFLPLNIFYIVTIVIMTVFLAIVLWKLMIPYVYSFVYYMFNSVYREYNKTIEKPRLLFHLIVMPFMLYSFVLFAQEFLIYNSINKHNYFYGDYLSKIVELRIVEAKIIESSIYLTGFTLSLLVLFFTRTKSFENYVIPKIEKKLNDYNCIDFVNNYKKSELEKIFENLIDENFISIIIEDENILDKDLFVEIISNEKLPESPIFRINMDNIQTQLFYSLFSEKIEKITLEKFLKIFENKNKNTNAQSIRASASNAKNSPKESDVIKSLFKG